MKIPVFLLILLSPHVSIAQPNPVELGDVRWLRSMDEARSQSQKSGKPILILFQEVPGCATCRNYGHEVLTHPLIVEAVETEFVPLAIYNNKGGHDAEVRERYEEPAWNNPVARIVDGSGKPLSPRLNGDYTSAGLVNYLTTHIIRTRGKAPGYLQLLADELTQSRGTMKRTYAMYCFWTGEALFGKLNGVVKTTAGFQGGREVVIVEYDPNVLNGSTLDEIAKQQKCSIASTGNFRPDSTPKYYLSKSRYRDIQMTELQKCRVNSALAEGQNPDAFLSPRQLKKKV